MRREEEPKETLSRFGPCVLCRAMASPELADLSEAEKKEARDWLRWARVKGEFLGLRFMFDQVKLEHIEECLGPKFDAQAFIEAYPLLQKVNDEIALVEMDIHLDIDLEQGSYLQANRPDNVCLADFDGDEIALYNNLLRSDQAFDEYDPTLYDSSGEPICSDGDGGHEREWCDISIGAASFWPLTTPKLQTLYVIDHGIKLKPGASLPAGARTFEGNGCRYVEVPEPADEAVGRRRRGRNVAIYRGPRTGRHRVWLRPISSR